MRHIGLFLVVAGTLAAIPLIGCASGTVFTGDAHVSDGPNGCFHHCQRADMVMAGYIFMGEYSTACVCRPRTATAGAQLPDEELIGLASGEVAAVAIQLRNAQEERERAAAR